MPRDDLDAWFDKADDVLRTWDGSPDAMTAGDGPGDVDPEVQFFGDARDVQWPVRRVTTAPRDAAGRPSLLRRTISSAWSSSRACLRLVRSGSR